MPTIRRGAVLLTLVVTAGTGLLIACGGEEAATAPAPAAPAGVASVTVSPVTADILVGSTVQLTATPMDAAGNVLPGLAVTWASTAPGVATVSEGGLVTGASPCLATITARIGGRSGSASITVSSAAGSVAASRVGTHSCG